jgi:hypothetical protein
MAGLFWTQEQDIGPSARAGHAMAFDSARHRMVLFGGDSAGSAFLADTWAWDGQYWTQEQDIGPGARTGHQLAFDSSRSRAVLFGGWTGVSVLGGDTWEWDGQYWTQIADTGPSPRTGHRLAFDNQRSTVVLFGGEAANGALCRDTWEWDGQTWTQRDDTGPPARRQHAMAFDSARQRVVLFGGDTGGATVGDTWEWDGTNWTQVGDTGPDPCAGAAMAFDGSAVLLFGGIAALTASNPPPRLFGLSWEWDGQHWTSRQDIGPAPRWGHALAFDSDRVRPVLFGGLTAAPGDASAADHLLGDTWEISVTATSAATQPKLTRLTLAPDGAAPMRGSDVTVTVGLDQVASAPVAVTVDFTPGPTRTVTIPSGSTTAAETVPRPGTPPGEYTVRASLGTSIQTATFQVI